MRHIHIYLRGLLVLLMLNLSVAAQAGFLDRFSAGQSEQPLPVEQVFKLTPEQTSASQMKLVWTIHPDYYLYQDKIQVTPSQGIEVVSRHDSPSEGKDDPLFGHVQVFHNRAEVSLVLGAKTANSEGSLSVTYQGCWDKGICYPPVTEEIPLTNIVDMASAQQLAAAASDTTQTSDSAEAVQAAPVALTSASEQDQFLSLLEGRSVGAILVAFFLAGLALAFTPCLFPMIPILSSIIVGQKHPLHRLHGFSLSLTYVLAMALTYTVVGVVIGLLGANIQVALQNPWVIGVFSALFVVLALSMFGFYQLQMPHWIQQRVSSGSSKGGSYLSVATMGVLSSLIVGPCMAAPLAGALIYIGQTGDPWLGGAALFILSFGMGLPLLLIGLSAGHWLPRAGAWMESVKAGFGVILLLMAIWMLDRIVPTPVTMGLTAGVLIISAIYLNALDRLHAKANGWHRFWKGIGVLMLIYGGVLLVGVFGGSNSLIYPLKGVFGAQVAQADTESEMPFERVTSLAQLDALLAQAKQNQQPVMLDFYADWCISCKELDAITFKERDVQRALERFVRIKVDVTSNDADAKALNKKYSVIGPPALIFYNASGQRITAARVIGVPDSVRFAAMLQQI